MPDALITRVLRKLAEKNRDKLLTETEGMMAEDYGIDVGAEREAIKEQDVPELVSDYYLLLKAVHHGEKPKQVRIDPDCRFILLVDGVRYNMKKMIPWHDRTNRRYMQEIESLFQDDFFSAVQWELNEKIQREW